MKNRSRSAIAAAVLALMTVPALAQGFSSGFTFLKSVRDRDGSAVDQALASPSSTVINYRDPGSGESALHIVVQRRDSAWVSFFLGRGARPDIQDNEGNSPLLLASNLGWADGVALLLRARASVDLANNRGETPLILAVQRQDAAVVRMLLARGADPARTDSVSGLSALDYARRNTRSPQILQMLEAPRAAQRPVAGPNP